MKGSTQFTVTHNGVPLGVVEVPAQSDRVIVAMVPLPAYSTVRPLVRAASAALADVALAREADARALQRGAELGRALELRDLTGTLVPADFIELTDWPGGTPEVAAFIRFRDSHAPVPADLPPDNRRDSDSSPPSA
jgi:hypothetical protein